MDQSGKMSDEELQQLTEKWSQQAFERPFKHRIWFNWRLKTTGGRYHLKDHHIDINPLMYEEFDLATLRGVVLHELCHYHLHLAGHDCHHTSEFKALLNQVGGLRYAPVTSQKKTRFKWVYQCRGCGIKIGRMRRFNVQRFVCRRCNSRFKLLIEK